VEDEEDEMDNEGTFKSVDSPQGDDNIQSDLPDWYIDYLDRLSNWELNNHKKGASG
jgi:hypothetical protein